MRSTSTAQVTSTARQAAGSPAARLLARAGLAARGIIYILVGWVAILVAIGHSSQEADQQGNCGSRYIPARSRSASHPGRRTGTRGA